MKPTLKIGLDVHGVADTNAAFFSALTRLFVENGHEVHILTGSEYTPELEQHLRKDLGLCWTHLFSITSHHRELGTEITYINGNPYLDETLWNRTKSLYCRENAIDLHLDDSSVYGRYFETPYARYSANQNPARKKKIAVIGGSFNPITVGHLKMAEAVLEFLPETDQVWLMPAFRHPFEKHRDYASERIRMVRLVESTRIRYFGYEIDHRLSGETFATFTRLLEDPDYFRKYEFSMVIGSDCVLDFDMRWKHAHSLSRLVRFIIVPRPGYDPSTYNGLLSVPPHVILRQAQTPDISATRIREKIRKGESVVDLVPEPVRQFIMEKGLYREEPEEQEKEQYRGCRTG
jgi:nicotinate-nucleotide adenylyltransferase